MNDQIRRWMTLCETQSQEHWELAHLFDQDVNVGWRLDKDQENRRKHNGLSLRDGIPVLADPANRYTLDYNNPNRDERERYIGRNGQNVLVVAVEWVDTGEELAAIRIISVRPALAFEINQGDDRMDEDIKPSQQGQSPATEPGIDPDNPPLTGKEVWRSGKERILQRIADQKAKAAARKAKSQSP